MKKTTKKLECADDAMELVDNYWSALCKHTASVYEMYYAIYFAQKMYEEVRNLILFVKRLNITMKSTREEGSFQGRKESEIQHRYGAGRPFKLKV
ncbi:MAG: hypothetical protein WAM14_26930 [Candidatus Nitrosopolaris sp.]